MMTFGLYGKVNGFLQDFGYVVLCENPAHCSLYVSPH